MRCKMLWVMKQSRKAPLRPWPRVTCLRWSRDLCTCHYTIFALVSCLLTVVSYLIKIQMLKKAKWSNYQAYWQRLAVAVFLRNVKLASLWPLTHLITHFSALLIEISGGRDQSNNCRRYPHLHDQLCCNFRLHRCGTWRALFMETLTGTSPQNG